MKRRWTMWTAIIIAAAMAAPLGAQTTTPEQNEDIQFIREWRQRQRAQEIAALLALNPEQTETLRAVKTDVDAIRDELNTQRDALREEAAATAKEIRSRIEQTGVMTADDEAALGAYRQKLRQLRRQQRLRVALATTDLEGLLTESQKQAMRDYANLRAGRGEARRKGRGMARRLSRAAGARLLLSDAFIGSLNN